MDALAELEALVKACGGVRRAAWAIGCHASAVSVRMNRKVEINEAFLARIRDASTAPRETVPTWGCPKGHRIGGNASVATRERRTKRGWATALFLRVRNRRDGRTDGRKRLHWEPCDFDVQWILSQFEAYPYCHYLLVPLNPFTVRAYDPWAPSLDRIDNERGYVKENVRLTSFFWNRMRGTNSVEETMTNLRMTHLFLEVGRVA